MPDLTGSWVGSTAGTSYASVLIEFRQSATEIKGVAIFSESGIGIYAYDVSGQLINGNKVTFRLTPRAAQAEVLLGVVDADCKLHGEFALTGTWKSTVGTEGVFELRRQILLSTKSRKVFVVHGRDVATKESVVRFLDKLKLVPVILSELASKGQTIVEKVETNSDVQFAVVLLTPDDIGYLSNEQAEAKPRARQNVILELGYFLAQLGRRNVCAVKKGEIELPSDYGGVAFVQFDDGGGWQLKLAAEIKAAGIPADLNLLLRTEAL